MIFFKKPDRTALGWTAILAALLYGQILFISFGMGISEGGLSLQDKIYTVGAAIALICLVTFGIRLLHKTSGKITLLLGIVGFLPIVYFLIQLILTILFLY